MCASGLWRNLWRCVDGVAKRGRREAGPEVERVEGGTWAVSEDPRWPACSMKAVRYRRSRGEGGAKGAQGQEVGCVW